jgi:SAM-dependent methyltransferase
LWTVSTELSGRERWNAKHRDVCVGGTETREWLARHRNLLAEKVPGRALGLAVDAVDVSDVATERVRERAGEGAPEIEARRMDLSDPETAFPHPSYDVICCFYFLKRPLLARLAAALAPGGLLFYETFDRDNADVVGGQIPAAVLLDHNELLRAFADLRVLRYREEIIGVGDRRRAVASLVAQR